MPFTISNTVVTGQILTSVTDVGVITANGALVTSGTPAVTVTASGGFLVNDGLITSLSFCLNAAASFSLMNRGLMTTENTCINISIANTSVTSSAITNAGHIVSTLSAAITSAEAGVTLQNSGLISGRSTAINLGSSDVTALNRINNSGVIEVQPTTTLDNAITSNGALRLVNTGTIFGTVNLGNGNDVVDNRAGVITGEIQLDDGNNLAIGGALGEVITSGSGLDTIRGEAGDDTLSSSLGHDLLRGGLGDDLLSASFGLDTLHGGLGDDTITGGNDTDLLFGGAGRDHFVFTAPGDSDPLQDPDRIADFKQREDLIDLSAFAPATFTFVGKNALTGAGTASFGYAKTAGLVTLLADLNGDGSADFRAEVAGPGALALSDFLL